MTPLTPDQEVLASLMLALEQMRATKPNDRSEKDRRYAVAITETEKAIAYFWYFVAREEAPAE